MPSTYTNNLAIEQIGTGEQSGTWGNTTNLNFDLIDQSICGLGSIQLIALGTTVSPNLLPITTGSVSDGRNAAIEYTSAGDLGVTTSAFVQLTPNSAERIITITNSMTGSTELEVFQGTYNVARSLKIANGDTVMCKFSGEGAASTVTELSTGLSVTDLHAQESITIRSATVGTDEFTIAAKIVNGESVLSTGFSGATDGLQVVADTDRIRVGINKTPEETDSTTTLHVSSPGEVSLRLDSTGANDANLRFCNDGVRSFSVYYDQSNASFRIFDNVQSSTRFRINQDGSIQIAGTLEGRNIATDGTKLDGIATGAQVNVGTNISVVESATTVAINSSTGTDDSIAAATTTVAGVMTGADKAKLDGIAASATNTAAPAITSNGTTPALASGITALEIRDLIVAPSKTGTGASGTWAINVTGSSASCTGNAVTATNATTAGNSTLSSVTADSAGNRALVLCTADGTSRAEALYKDAGTSLYFNTSNNTLISPNISATTITATGNITAYSSDSRLKLNQMPIDGALNKVMSIGGYTFDWDIDKCSSLDFKPANIHEHGVIAQEIETVVPDAVCDAPFDRDLDGNSISGDFYKTVRYDRLVPLLIEAIKELKAEVDTLKAAK